MSILDKQGDFFCRAMQSSDLAAVIRIQADAYVEEILETEEIIQTRFRQAPHTAWVVERAGDVCGYLVGYRSVLGEVTPWGGEFVCKPDSTTLYLHDLAICKSAVGYGLGPKLVNHALAEMKQREFRSAALVSVQNTKSFWQKLGFAESGHLDSVQKSNLTSYSSVAIYMTREISSW
ncbi:MAG TPA: GNAT family N-acetyltransferase [Cellvibrio sp.]|nr:GNAT family N-acetyltransferase [Cellvibrio sp.]